MHGKIAIQAAEKGPERPSFVRKCSFAPLPQGLGPLFRVRHLLDYRRFLSGEGLYPRRNMSVVCEADPNMLGVWKYVTGSNSWVGVHGLCGFVGPPGLEPGTVRL